MEKEVKKADPVIYKDRLQPLATVMIIATSERKMMGMQGIEKVETVLFKSITNASGDRISSFNKEETTWDNFNSKYIAISDDREEKLNQILKQ